VGGGREAEAECCECAGTLDACRFFFPIYLYNTPMQSAKPAKQLLLSGSAEPLLPLTTPAIRRAVYTGTHASQCTLPCAPASALFLFAAHESQSHTFLRT
jgi:hypothetical protein